MKMPSNPETVQLIAILRVLDYTHDTVADTLHVSKTTVGAVENWLTYEELGYLMRFFDDAALHALVVRELPDMIPPPEDGELDHTEVVRLSTRASLVTADAILRHYRPGEYTSTTSTREERQRFSALLQQWREQAQLMPIDSLLTAYRWGTQKIWDLPESPDEATLDSSEGVYLRALKRVRDQHSNTHTAPLPVEGEIGFDQMKRAYPSSEVWQVQASWHEKNADYMNTFVAWLKEVHDEFRRFCEEVQADPDWQEMCRYVANLLVFAIESYSPSDDKFWTWQLGRVLEYVDSFAWTWVGLVTDKKVEEGVPIYLWTGPLSLWNSREGIREKAQELLASLDRMQTVHYALLDALRALETIIVSEESGS